MTQAICLRCGESKVGALTPCFKCGFDPKTPEDKAKSIVLSSHHMDATSLKNATKAIQAGEAITIPDDLISGYAKTIASQPKPRAAGRFIVGCLLAAGAVGSAVFLSIIAAVEGRWQTAAFRLGTAAALAYVVAFFTNVFFLWERSEFEGRDRKERWVLLNALPIAAVVAAIVYFARQGKF